MFYFDLGITFQFISAENLEELKCFWIALSSLEQVFLKLILIMKLVSKQKRQKAISNF